MNTKTGAEDMYESSYLTVWIILASILLVRSILDD